MDVNICSDNKWSLNDKLERKNPYWKHKENTKELFGKKNIQNTNTHFVHWDADSA